VRQAVTPTPVVECLDVVKWFGGVQALRGVSMHVGAGEVVGLVGDNGAGKSTLVKVLSGLHTPDGGEVRVAGEVVRLSPATAREHGVETVYQDLALCDNLDAVANVLLGQEPLRLRLGPFRFIDRRKAEQVTRERIAAVGGRIPDLAVSVRRLSGGQRQAIAIARATVHAHRLMMLDEPTAALGLAQRRTTLELIRGVAAQGVGVLVISHNLEDVFAVCDRLVGLRLGEVTLDAATGDTTREEVIACMTTGRTHLGR
jgi:ABC-type sugar transport system ATPase subunit